MTTGQDLDDMGKKIDDGSLAQLNHTGWLDITISTVDNGLGKFEHRIHL